MNYIIKTAAIFVTLLASISLSHAQNICLGTDATVCIGTSVTIEDCNPGTTAGTLLNAPTWVTLSDDSFSGKGS